MVTKVSGSKWEVESGRRRPLHKEDLHDVCSSSNIVRAIEPKGTKWVGHVMRVGEKINYYRVWWGNRKEIGYLEDLDVDGKALN